MRELIASVVSEGTAKNAKVAGFSIGGKTGTSEKIDVFDENGQPGSGQDRVLRGHRPMDDPEYIVLVALDTPSRQTGIYISGGVMAAPTVGAVLGDILPYLGVERHFSQSETQGKEIVLEQYIDLTEKDASSKLKRIGLSAKFTGTGDRVTAQLPQAGQTVPGGTRCCYTLAGSPEAETVAMADFTA